jgi:glycosyltransferase involved in cell wall biosynthesis
MPTLSIVIPAYNEERFIGRLLELVRAVPLDPLGVTKEIIVVDDCSKDRTSEIASAAEGVRVHRMPVNGGKGRAVRAGIDLATGDYLIIQDADLEYDPQDYVPMVQALLDGRGDVVYGSRYLGKGPAREPVAGCVPRGPQPQPGDAGLHRPLHHRHGHRAEAVSADAAAVTRARNDGL